MQQREVIFYSEGTKMVGTIYLPDDYKDGEKRPGIIANSGWTGLNKVYPAMFARQMTKFGYVCMGFDYRGFKPSGGISGMDKYTTLEMEVDDVNNAVTFFKRGRRCLRQCRLSRQDRQGRSYSELLHRWPPLDAYGHGQ